MTVPAMSIVQEGGCSGLEHCAGSRVTVPVMSIVQGGECYGLEHCAGRRVFRA